MAQYINFGTKVTGAKIVDLITAKANSRIEFEDEDTLLQIFVDAAEAEIEKFIGGPVLERNSVEIEQNVFGAVTIPFEVREVTKVEWLDAAGTATEIDPLDYDHFANEVNIGIDKPSDFNRLKITCKAGYPAAEMPADIKRAALLIFSHADTYRENMLLKLNTSAQALLRPYKNY